MDEAGRGSLAGPVVVAAVILGVNTISGLRDSKKLSAKRRDILAALVREESMCFAIAFSEVHEIDKVNIRQATMLAMQRAVAQIVICPDKILVDGDFAPDFPYPAQAIVGGDDKIPEIMAASILAKTARDAVMLELDKRHAAYGFASNKGYPTPQHLAALQANGHCSCHRKSFAPIKEYITKEGLIKSDLP